MGRRQDNRSAIGPGDGRRGPVPAATAVAVAAGCLRVLLLSACVGHGRAEPPAQATAPEAGAPDRAAPIAAGSAAPDPEVPTGLRCLALAYPEALCGATASGLRWCDGTEMAYDDGPAEPDHDHMLERASLKDQMAQRYPAGPDYPVPLPRDFDPGRARHEPFFRKMYGATRAEVEAHLGEVRWMRRTVDSPLRITTRNGVDDALQAISDRLEDLPRGIRACAGKTAGGFHWRTIRDTRRPSMHSFGIAVDIGGGSSDYWKWRKVGPDGLLPYRNRIPLEVVGIFEEHGFIWGGKWYHYDTMHFEYRPELLHPECVVRSGGAEGLEDAGGPSPEAPGP